MGREAFTSGHSQIKFLEKRLIQEKKKKRNKERKEEKLYPRCFSSRAAKNGAFFPV